MRSPESPPPEADPDNSQLRWPGDYPIGDLRSITIRERMAQAEANYLSLAQQTCQNLTELLLANPHSQAAITLKTAPRADEHTVHYQLQENLAKDHLTAADWAAALLVQTDAALSDSTEATLKFRRNVTLTRQLALARGGDRTLSRLLHRGDLIYTDRSIALARANNWTLWRLSYQQNLTAEERIIINARRRRQSVNRRYPSPLATLTTQPRAGALADNWLHLSAADRRLAFLIGDEATLEFLIDQDILTSLETNAILTQGSDRLLSKLVQQVRLKPAQRAAAFARGGDLTLKELVDQGGLSPSERVSAFVRGNPALLAQLAGWPQLKLPPEEKATVLLRGDLDQIDLINRQDLSPGEQLIAVYRCRSLPTLKQFGQLAPPALELVQALARQQGQTYPQLVLQSPSSPEPTAPGPQRRRRQARRARRRPEPGSDNPALTSKRGGRPE